MFSINMERLSLLLLANHFILKMYVWQCLLNQLAALVNSVTSALELTSLASKKQNKQKNNVLVLFLHMKYKTL